MDETCRNRPRRRWLGASLAAGAVLACPAWARAASVVRPWPVDKATPRLDLTDMDGKVWSLAALRGQVVVLNFWASWCEPCRAEMPSLELLASRHERAGLAVLTVNYKEPLPAIRRFLDVQPVLLPILLDRDGMTAAAWTPRVFPATVLIDRLGVPRTQVLGELDWMAAAARELIHPLLAQPRTV